MHLKLELLAEQFSVCKLAASAKYPGWLNSSSFSSVTRTDDELSIVCETSFVPPEICAEPGWSCLKVVGMLDFALVGILASLINPLAEAGISIFALSSFNTDYLLLKNENVDKAVTVLKQHGHSIKFPSV